MKNTYLILILLVLFFRNEFHAQQNVLITDGNATTPAASSLLELNSTNKGVLIPRVALTSTTNQSPVPVGTTVATALLIYNTATINDVTPGFYYWENSKWNRFDTGNNIGDWKINGNTSLTSPAAPTTYGTSTIGTTENWIGTTDNVDFVVGTNQIERFRILKSTGKVGIGTAAPAMRLDVTDASTTANDATIRGAATGNAATFGVLGTSTSATGQGVFGFNTNASGTGVIGAGNNLAAQYLVSGSGGAFTSSNVGVYGYGNNTAASLGVYGVSNSPTGDGINAINNVAAGTADGNGLYATTAQSAGFGVWGTNSNSSGTGVVGAGNGVTSQYLTSGSGGAFSSTNVGVFGYGNNTALSCGVLGRSVNATGVGVIGEATIDSGTGVYATNSAANGTAIGFAVDARSNQTGGSTIMANMQGNYYYSNSVISATINSSIAGGLGIISDASNATGVAVQGQTSGAGASTAIVGINSGVNVQTVGVYGVAVDATAGLSFSKADLRKSIYGQGSHATGSYRFGVYGNGGISIRSGGVIGVDGGTTVYAAGSLGYYAANSTDYGVYGFGKAYQTGSATGYIPFKNESLLATKENEYSQLQKYVMGVIDDEINFDSWSSKEPNSSIGLGIYGGVMGGWIKGLVYGTNLSGAKYGLYVHGKTITNNVITTLTNIGKDERVATYAPTAMKVDVVDRGKGKLKNGKAIIEFDEDFSKLLSENEDLTITVTPLGSSKGLYIEKYSTNEFIVIENEAGSSNVEFNWIAVGVKTGYEKVAISEEIINKDFEVKMNGNYGVMFNDNNPENPLYSIWYDGKKVRFDKPPFNKIPEPLFKEYQEPKIQNIEFSIEKKMFEKEVKSRQ